MRFIGLNALVTGSSRGFGRLIAIALAREGANRKQLKEQGQGGPR